MRRARPPVTAVSRPAGTFVASADCASCRPCPAGTFSSAAGRGGCRMCRKCEGTGGDTTSPALTSRGKDVAPARGGRATGQRTLRAYAKATSLIFVRAKVRAFAAPRCACCNLRLVFSLAGIFQYLKKCSSTSDAECTCKEGYRCGGDGCTYCTRSCGVGQESTGNGRITFPQQLKAPLLPTPDTLHCLLHSAEADRGRTSQDKSCHCC